MKHDYRLTDKPYIVRLAEDGGTVREYKCKCGATVNVTMMQFFFMKKGECVPS